MGEMITKPDTNPIIVAVLNCFLGCGGYFFIGQTKKGIITAIICTVGSALTCGLGSIFMFATIYDGYLLGQKLQAGESIGEMENGLDFLNKIFK